MYQSISMTLIKLDYYSCWAAIISRLVSYVRSNPHVDGFEGEGGGVKSDVFNGCKQLATLNGNFVYIY